MFEKGQVGRIRTEFMRKDDVIAALQAENERLRNAVDAIKLLHTFGQNLNEAMDNAKANAAKESQP
jgi:hypothetical protein